MLNVQKNTFYVQIMDMVGKLKFSRHRYLYEFFRMMEKMTREKFLKILEM